MNNNQKFIDEMQTVLNFLREHPDFPIIGMGYTEISLLASVHRRSAIADAARMLGEAEKRYDETWMEISRQFGSIRVGAYIFRSMVCRRVVVGKKTLPAHPATPEREVDDIRWECDEPILKDDSVSHVEPTATEA